jgi:hypothetical protein
MPAESGTERNPGGWATLDYIALTMTRRAAGRDLMAANGFIPSASWALRDTHENESPVGAPTPARFWQMWVLSDYTTSLLTSEEAKRGVPTSCCTIATPRCARKNKILQCGLYPSIPAALERASSRVRRSCTRSGSRGVCGMWHKYSGMNHTGCSVVIQCR